MIDKLLKIKSANTKVTVYKTELNKGSENAKKYDLGVSGIVFFDSVEWFVKKASTIIWVSNERHRNHHLIYVPGLTASDIFKAFVDGFEIDHVNFLMHDTDNSIELVATFMLTPQACKQLQLKTINRFDLQTMEWENSIFTPKNMKTSTGAS